MAPRNQSRKPLGVEQLEQRLLMAGDTYLINFQTLAAAPVTRYLVDGGEVFGARPGGFNYGWSSDHTDQSRLRTDPETGLPLHPDVRYSTLVHFEIGQNWEFQLANGVYDVTVAVGDPAFNDGIHTINVEGVNYWNAVPDTDLTLTKTMTVAVSDGRLTINSGATANKATRINFVQIVGVPSGPNQAPTAPTITEPVFDGKVVSPADVHMEAGNFVDGDGNLHKSTDWEIWTTGPGAELVWETKGIESVERLHTHLGDGIFVNSRAGFTSLAQNLPHELRVRFRDDAGAVGSYAVRQFQTGSANSAFPLELEGIAGSPAPVWTDINNTNVDLPFTTTGGGAASLEVNSADFLTALLRIEGRAAAGNTVTTAPAQMEHSDVRVTIRAGGSALVLSASKLTLSDAHGDPVTLYLPAINLAAGQRLDLWVSSTGATYYGAAAQTTPNFSLLARAATLNVPFIVTQPGYVIEEVSANYRLPVNIAFVPNPGSLPTDPLYFVTELYGSIQVVTRGGVKHQFATGLLDYNPTGPISGSGEQGLTGLAVERDATNPDIYNLYVGMLWDNGAAPGGATHYPKVEKLTSAVGGLAMASRAVLLNMQPETQGQSHQISNITIGPDGKLYVHNGDGFNAATAQNLDQFRGKVLRMNKDGTAPSDNPFYSAANGITARDYVYAYGLRNPFGGAWRAADGKHYSVENGPSVDRFAQINRGVNYGYNGTDASMTINAIYNWNPATAPVNIAFVQSETFAGSQFPKSMQDRAFVSESGPTYAAGPQSNAKRITQFTLSGTGSVLSGPSSLVTYIGSGRSTIVALAAGPDGLYFSEFYEETGASGATASGARIFRLRYVNPIAGDYDIDGDVDSADATVWRTSFGSNLLLAADGNRDGVVDAADYTVWRDNFTPATSSLTAAVASAAVSMSEVRAPEMKVGTQARAPRSVAPRLLDVAARVAHPSNDVALRLAARDAALARWGVIEDRADEEISTASKLDSGAPREAVFAKLGRKLRSNGLGSDQK